MVDVAGVEVRVRHKPGSGFVVELDDESVRPVGVNDGAALAIDEAVARIVAEGDDPVAGRKGPPERVEGLVVDDLFVDEDLRAPRRSGR